LIKKWHQWNFRQEASIIILPASLYNGGRLFAANGINKLTPRALHLVATLFALMKEAWDNGST
jgi:hypothetical protein